VHDRTQINLLVNSNNQNAGGRVGVELDG